ncbi:unnamed protein product [Peronospora effusa]|uniref:FYVE-type domain-containing protein n=1 Tax=Peronospora effusa TaxID=542832 RepID=A0A3M6VTA1_9STRA|nr:hypothetical protein DD238_002038 [Peronospora effusa]CAI5707776.1 unnamed protein product [Peronospora effusa]
MVYGSLYRSRQQKASSTASRPSDTPSGDSHTSQEVSNCSSDRLNAHASGNTDSVTSNAYLHFTEQQQDALLLDARGNAAALLVDAVADAEKWQFVTTRGPLNVYELRADSMHRVSSMMPADPLQLSQNMHTMLATTRVRATLDDFMRLMASPKRDTFQNVQAALFEERVQLADVFTSFGVLPSGRNDRSSSTSSTSSSSHSQSGVETEQYAIKYVSIKGRTARNNSGATLNASSASTSLKFGGKNRHRERQAARLHRGKGRKGADSAQEQGLTLCVAEYATIRRAYIRGPMAHNQAQDFEDQRIGIISQHSIEDPGVTRYCKPIVTSIATRSKVSSSQQANFALTARALIQFSGFVVYPVASSVAGENVLEVLIKFSCYDANGVTATRRQNMLAYLTAFQQLDTVLLVMRLRESPYLTSENWVKARKICCVCQGKFSMSRRKHHCRLCGDVACSKCSEVHQIKLGKAGKCPFRICYNCEPGTDDNQRLSKGRMNLQAQGVAQPPRTPGDSITSLRRRLGSGSAPPRSPEDDEEYSRPPSTNSSSGDSSDMYDSQGLLSSHASTTADRTLGSNMSGSTVSSFNSSHGLGAFGKSSSSKTLSISSLGGSFYKPSNASNATTASSSRGSRFDYESENDIEGNDIDGKDDDSDTDRVVERTRVSQEVEKESEVDLSLDADSIEAIEVASVCSSSPSSPSSIVMQSDQFYKRFSELSLMDFHDSEFDLSLKGGLPGAGAGRFTNKSELDVFDFDDSEADVDSGREDLDGIGEEENEDGEKGEEDICDFDLQELDEADEDDGMEFHDSNVGIDFKLQDLNLQEYQGLDELEEGDEEYDEEVLEEIHTNMVLSRSRVGSPLDEERAARLAEYGIMDSGKEHIYDLVAKQAAQHTNCSLATISFVDARREFIKSSFGLARELCEVPLSHSLTAEIMRRFPTRKGPVVKRTSSDEEVEDSGEVVTVLDAKQDDILATNFIVTEAPNLRFIMGVPFRASDGVVLGALIVADTQSRTSVSSRQRSLLENLAEQVSALLEDLWTRNQERTKVNSSQSGHQIHDKLADLLSQSYTTGLQMQQNELKIQEQSSSSVTSFTHQLQYANDFHHMQSVEL